MKGVDVMSGVTKEKLKSGEVALGGWLMTGHPSIAEIFAGEGFDWVCLDMEHTCNDIHNLHEISLALKGTGCDLLARLHSCDPVQAKLVLDAGADGIIVPSVNTGEQAELAVKMAKFPPKGFRGASFARATDFGRNFKSYYEKHNDNVIVVVMLEHLEAVRNVDEILSVDGIDATLIGPYDLSASMGLAGQLRHPEVEKAQDKLLKACLEHKVPAGFHVVPVSSELISERIKQGYKFIGCSLDTELLIYATREILKGKER